MKGKSSICFSFCLTVLLTNTLIAQTWRSQLYPKDWTPGYRVGNMFLHDFSYAGYMMGEQPLPESVGSGQLVDVTQPPYNADKTGANDVTAVLQKALDDVGKTGGGAVYLPAGTYKVKPASGNAAIYITYSNVILKGDGIGKTFIRCFAENMRSKQVIAVGASKNWNAPESGSTACYLDRDIPDTPAKTIYLKSTGNLAADDWVIIRSDRSAAWIDEHQMNGFWAADANKGVTFYRRITAVDPTAKTIEIDIPTRYYMKTRDNARVYKVTPSVQNVGLQDFSIGNKANPKSSGWGEEDYTIPDAGAYEVHAAFLLKFTCAVHSWAKNIASYQAGNTAVIHMSSNGLDMDRCRNLTVDNCDFSYPQYEGGGGNGYAINHCSQECLIVNCTASSVRHGYAFKYSYASGNVIHAFSSVQPKYASDFHMYMSMSNLIDNQHMNGDLIDATVRPYGANAGDYHGVTTSQTVFWNTNGIAYQNGSHIIDSRQHGYGYIIGTRGPAYNVKTTPTVMSSKYGSPDTAPEDFREGINNGANLEPRSLYYDQLARRLGKGAGLPAVAGGGGKKEISIYPNPASPNGYVTVQLNFPAKDKENICITDMWGRTVFSKELETNVNKLEINNLQLVNGIYAITVNAKSGEVSKLLIVK
jgi:hypothetical protein